MIHGVGSKENYSVHNYSVKSLLPLAALVHYIGYHQQCGHQH